MLAADRRRHARSHPPLPAQGAGVSTDGAGVNTDTVSWHICAVSLPDGDGLVDRWVDPSGCLAASASSERRPAAAPRALVVAPMRPDDTSAGQSRLAAGRAIREPARPVRPTADHPEGRHRAGSRCASWSHHGTYGYRRIAVQLARQGTAA
jgi:hypothetical protein